MNSDACTWRRTRVRPLVGDRRAHDAASGLAVSQRGFRKRIEEAFPGWIKMVAGQERDQVPRLRARRMDAFTLTAAAYNLARLPKIHRGFGVKGPGQLSPDRPLAHLRGRHLVGSRLPRSERPGDAYDYRARRRNRFRRAWRPASRSNTARDSIRASTGQDPTKATRSRAKDAAELLDDGTIRNRVRLRPTAMKP